MGENSYKYLVRLPPILRDRLVESAEYYRRSLNSDIIARLHQSFSGLPEATQHDGIAPPLHHHIQDALHPGLSNDEQWLVRRFRDLPPAKRVALKDLLS